MPLTAEQLEKIREKEQSFPSALRRNPLNKYKEGWFHVTLNVRDEAPVLGYVTGDATVTDGSANAPRCMLTKLGEKVEKEWLGISRYYPLCKCEAIQVMPEHIHALLHLSSGNNGHLGRIVNGLMIGCTHHYWDTLGIPWREMRQNLEATLKLSVGVNAMNKDEQSKALRAQWQDRDHTHSFRGPALFTRGYNDVEALTDEEIEIKRRYIHDNPRKRLITRSKRDRFSIQRDRTSHNWHTDAVKRGLCADRFLRCNASTLNSAFASVLPRLKVSEASLRLDFVGNVSLLAAEKKLPLICHRADAMLFEQQCEAVMQAAREGAVIVSAFISPKEREIMKALLQESLPLIEVMDNGFADRYKPQGKSFYAVAEQRLCQITPWEYEYQREVKVSREMYMVMNELVRVISTEGEDWWKKYVTLT